jgi:hypothetical protein
MIEVFLFRLPADISRRPHTWSTRVRVEQAVPIHQVITSKTGHPVRPFQTGLSERCLLAGSYQVSCVSRRAGRNRRYEELSVV